MNMAEKIKALETAMWEAAQARSPEEFLKLVDAQAVMVCGGFRCTGAQYAEIIREFDLADYIISNFEVVAEDENTCQVHYVIKTSVSEERNADLAGVFHITSTWKNSECGWRLIFNMDSRVE